MDQFVISLLLYQADRHIAFDLVLMVALICVACGRHLIL